MYASKPIDDKPSSNKCEDDLRQLTCEARAFFKKFEAVHGQANNYAFDLKKQCDKLASAEYYYVSGKYKRDDLNKLRCYLAEFVSCFKETHDTSKVDRSKFYAECETLTKLADEFVDSHNIVCGTETYRNACADLNKLRCNLSAFFATFKLRRTKALVDLDQIKGACHTLTANVKDFKINQDLTCKTGKGEAGRKDDLFSLQFAVNIFFTIIAKTQCDLSTNVNDLLEICEAIAFNTTAWLNQLKC